MQVREVREMPAIFVLNEDGLSLEMTCPVRTAGFLNSSLSPLHPISTDKEAVIREYLGEISGGGEDLMKVLVTHLQDVLDDLALSTTATPASITAPSTSSMPDVVIRQGDVVMGGEGSHDEHESSDQMEAETSLQQQPPPPRHHPRLRISSESEGDSEGSVLSSQATRPGRLRKVVESGESGEEVILSDDHHHHHHHQGKKRRKSETEDEGDREKEEAGDAKGEAEEMTKRGSDDEDEDEAEEEEDVKSTEMAERVRRAREEVRAVKVAQKSIESQLKATSHRIAVVDRELREMGAGQRPPEPPHASSPTSTLPDVPSLGEGGEGGQALITELFGTTEDIEPRREKKQSLEREYGELIESKKRLGLRMSVACGEQEAASQAQFQHEGEVRRARMSHQLEKYLCEKEAGEEKMSQEVRGENVEYFRERGRGEHERELRVLKSVGECSEDLSFLDSVVVPHHFYYNQVRTLLWSFIINGHFSSRLSFSSFVCVKFLVGARTL